MASSLSISRAARVDVVVAATLAAVLVLRLPFLSVAAGPDEAGLLIVGGQWDGPGDSLYGDHWVDRPPLLLLIARFAALHGGLLTWRLIGLLAVVVAVLAVFAAARRLAGPTAARVAAVATAILLVDPWLGADRVNAELLAAPWVALGMLGAVRAVESPRSVWPALVGGCAVAAMSTKQNIADVVVFAGVLTLACIVTRRLPVRDGLRLAAAGAGGAAVVAGTLTVVAAQRGTAPAALLDALYAFRWRAAEVLAAHPEQATGGREAELLLRALIAGLVVIVAAVVLAPLRRELRTPATVAVSVTVLFGCASAALGGSYWSHYLIQPAIPAALGLGLLATRFRTEAVMTLAAATASAVVGAVLVLPALTAPDPATTAARAIAAVAGPGDTIVHAWGRPDVVLASGLRSPDPQLWSLPVRTDDPRLAHFTAVLAGPRAPTWLVSRRHLTSWGIDAHLAQQVVDTRYRVVGHECGSVIRLRRDVHRPEPPHLAVRCKGASFLR